MNLIKRRSLNIFDPFRDFLNLHAETVCFPAVDVYENKENLVIKADLPGVKQNEIDIAVEDGVLRIKGEKKKENEIKEDNFYRLDRVYGSFERSFALPTNVDATKIKANYKEGVLEITLPKKEESKPKQVKININ